jgi:hypothetical protein
MIDDIVLKRGTAYSVLEIKNFHSLVLRRSDQNIVLVLDHRAHEVLMLRFIREEIVSRRTHNSILVLFLTLAAETTLFFI